MNHPQFCPVHEDEVHRCSDYCLPERVAFRTVAHAFRVYWYDRRRGISPMDRAEYRCRFDRPTQAQEAGAGGVKGYLYEYGGKASAPKTTCPVCGAVYLQHWMSVRFMWPDGTRASSGYRYHRDVRRTDTHVLACEKKTKAAQ